MNMTSRIISILLMFIMVFSMCSMTFAEMRLDSGSLFGGGGKGKDNGDLNISSSSFTTAGGNSAINGVASSAAGVVIGILKIIAYAVAFGMLVYIGIKYMTKGAGAKAEVKDTLLPYLIGAILVAAAATIADAVMGLSF